MDRKIFDKKIQYGRLRMASRRVAALFLAAVMCAGAYTPSAKAATVGMWPLQAVTNVADPNADPVVPDGSGEAPTITVEVNGVIDQGRKLTGFVEVAIRVKPGVLHLDSAGNIVTSTQDPAYDHSETQPFSSLAVALEYSDKLTPWEWEKIDGDWNRLDENQPGNQTTMIDATSAVGGGFSAGKMLEIDPLHRSTRIAQAAISTKADADGNNDGVESNDGGYLYLMAQGFTAKDFNNEDTVLAVVRFKYALDGTNEQNNPWGTMFSNGLNNPAVTDWIDPASPKCLVKLADAAVVREPDDRIVNYELSYDSGKSVARPQGNGFYYSADTTDGREAFDPSKPTTAADFVSTTSNCMEVALVDTTAATPSTTTVVPGKINYTLVNKLSYNFTSGDSAVILYYDWDDRHIGTQVLSPGDAREAVNRYVEETFIHPDLRYSAHKDDPDAADYTDSLLRENTYRGEYPYDAPVAIPDVTSSTYEADLAAYRSRIEGKVADDGAQYPLTNKLDYVFYKRYTEAAQTVTDDPDGTPGSGDETTAPARTLVDPDGAPDSGDEYYHIDSYDARLLGGLTADDVEEPGLLELPYIYGWAVVDDLGGITDVWTTLGTAEHTPYRGMDAANGNAPQDATVDTTYGVPGQCLQFADFSNLQKGQVVRVKAVYEPGAELKYLEFYNAISKPDYERYGETGSSTGGVYAISFAYARVNAAGQGVSRMRDPSVRIDYVPDVEGEGQKPFSIGVDLDNYDTLSVTFTPSSALMSMEYSLRDKKVYDATRQAVPEVVNYNFYTGAERSPHNNLTNIMENYDYEKHPYTQHVGSMGFVTQATMNQLERLCREALKTGVMADLETNVNLNMMKDLNFKAGFAADGVTPTEYIALQAKEFRTKLLDAYRIAENADLDWHQLQYHLINSTYVAATGVVSGGLTNTGGVISPAASTLAYNWCRIDNCSGGPEPINNWSDLMKAAADYVYTPNGSALKQLKDTFGLRQGITAQPFADKDAMKDALITVVSGLQANFTKAQVEGLTWRQVQYLMDLVDNGTGVSAVTPGNLPADDDIAPTGSTGKDYWWESGGSKTISTWQELLEIQYNITKNDYFAGNDATSGWRSSYDVTAAPALTGKVRDKDSGGNWITPSDPGTFTTKSVALRKDGSGTPFDTADSGNGFLTALNTAISTLTTGTSYAGGSFAGISLMEIQHALLGKAYSSEADLMDDTVAGDINYWWITGASTPTDLKSLVQLVEQVLDGAPDDMLSNVTLDLVSGAPFWLRGDSAGKKFADDAALRTALKTAVGAWRAQAGNNSGTAPWPDATGTNWSAPTTRQVWSQLQHLLLGKAYAADPDPGPTYAYWWYGNGHKPITNLEELLEAAWNTWGGSGGAAPATSADSNAMDALESLDVITGVAIKDGGDPNDYIYFRKNTDGEAFDHIDGFKAALKSTMQKITDMDNSLSYATSRDWIEIQHMLLGNTYRPATNIFGTGLRDDSSIKYWWENGGSMPEESTVSYEEADALIAEYMGKATTAWDYNLGNITSSDISISIPADVVTKLNLQDGSGNVLREAQIIQYIVEAANEFGTEVWDNSVTSAWSTYLEYPELKLDWKSFQYWILHKDEANIGDKQKALKDKGYGEISAAPYNITWTPEQPAPADYTKGDALIAEYMSEATTAWDYNLGDITTSDITFSISASDAVALNLQDGSGNVLREAQIIQYIVEAANEFGTEVWDNGGTSAWNTYLEYPELKLDWKSFQYWILHKDEANLGDKQKALKDKSSDEISAAPYNITWAPEPPAPVSYAEADALIAEYMGTATTAWDYNLGDITTSDITFSISASDAVALNLQDGSGNVLREAQIIQYIVEAANEFGTEVWDNGGTSAWNTYLEYPELKLDWKSFQYWILHKDEANIGDKQKALKDKGYGEISAAPYNITWTPNQTAAARTFSIQKAPLKALVKASKPVTTEEATDVVTSADGLRTTTTTTRTTKDPNTGVTEIVEEVKTELIAEDKLVTTVDVTTTTINTKTGDYTRTIKLGTPVITDAADIGMSGARDPEEPEEPKEPVYTEEPKEPVYTLDKDTAIVAPSAPVVSSPDVPAGVERLSADMDTVNTPGAEKTVTAPAKEVKLPEEDPASDDPTGEVLPPPAEETEPEPEKDAADPPPVAYVWRRLRSQRLQRYWALPTASGPLYAGPPNTRLRPLDQVLIGIVDHNILTTGRTIL